MAHRQQLCSICETIPFDPELKTMRSYGYDGPLVWELGTFRDVRNRKKCNFCQVVASSCVKNVSLWRLPVSPNDDEEVSVTLKVSQGVFHASLADLGTDIHVKGSNSSPVGTIAMTHQLDKWIDFNEVKRWISACEREHADTDSECRPMPFNAAVLPRTEKGQLDFRIIDVDAMCVVYASAKTKYVALSYVWGRTTGPQLSLTSDNEEALSQPKALEENRSKIPTTILDAITVVRELGERYLWVDRLCLLQDDIMELQECVAIMDLFYEMATFTIVAAGGEDSFAGLEGVPPTRRKWEAYLDTTAERDIVRGLTLSVVIDVDTLLRRSVYGSRGWTMQEEVLSHRALIFIFGQVYWKCGRSYFNEKLNWRDRTSLLDQNYAKGSVYNWVFQGGDLADFEDFATILGYYASRQLSFEGDALRAAQGMLRKYSRLSGLHCFEGLSPPLKCSVLFRKNRTPYSRSFGRRPGFPSYSWAGWKSSPLYPDHFSHATRGLQQIEDNSGHVTGPKLKSWIEWHCKFKDGQTYQFSRTGRLRKAPPPRLENTKKNAPRQLQDLPIAVTDVDFVMIHATSYPLLFFWTVVVTFRMEPKTSINPDERIEYPPNLIDFDVIDRSGRKIGEDVSMDMAAPWEAQVRQFAIILSSDTEVWALLLKWEDDVAERRGIVILPKDALDRCLDPGARWKAIALG